MQNKTLHSAFLALVAAASLCVIAAGVSSDVRPAADAAFSAIPLRSKGFVPATRCDPASSPRLSSLSRGGHAPCNAPELRGGALCIKRAELSPELVEGTDSASFRCVPSLRLRGGGSRSGRRRRHERKEEDEEEEEEEEDSSSEPSRRSSKRKEDSMRCGHDSHDQPIPSMELAPQPCPLLCRKHASMHGYAHLLDPSPRHYARPPCILPLRLALLAVLMPRLLPPCLLGLHVARWQRGNLAPLTHHPTNSLSPFDSDDEEEEEESESESRSGEGEEEEEEEEEEEDSEEGEDSGEVRRKGDSSDESSRSEEDGNEESASSNSESEEEPRRSSKHSKHSRRRDESSSEEEEEEEEEEESTSEEQPRQRSKKHRGRGRREAESESEEDEMSVDYGSDDGSSEEMKFDRKANTVHALCFSPRPLARHIAHSTQHAASNETRKMIDCGGASTPWNMLLNLGSWIAGGVQPCEEEEAAEKARGA
jgi:hypothetical protein